MHFMHSERVLCVEQRIFCVQNAVLRQRMAVEKTLFIHSVIVERTVICRGW